MIAARTTALVLLVVAACDEPNLTIELRSPSGLPGPVTRTTVTAYVSETLTCDAIAFGDVEVIDLNASRIQEVELTQSGAFTNLPRIDRKLFVARSFMGELSDIPAAAGCAEVGEIADHSAIGIDSQLIASVALSGSIGGGTFSDRRIAVDVDQPNGAALAGREVRWTTIGPNGSFGGAHVRTSLQAGLTIATNDRGRADVEPAESDVFGPMVARVSVAWADRPLPLVQGFMHGLHVSVPLDASGNTASSPPVCVRRRRLGRPTVACLLANSATQRVVELSLSGVDVQTRDLSAPGVETAFSLVSAPAPIGETERLYALLSDGRWLGLDGTFDGSTADLCKMQLGTCTVQPVRSVALPDCGGGATKVVIELARNDGKNQFETFTSTGIRVPGLATRVRGSLRIIGAGCVGYGEALAEALVVTTADALNGQNLAFVDCGRETACSVSWIGSPVVAFAPGPAAGDLPRLVGSVNDITGPVMVDWTFAPDIGRNGAPTVVLREQRRTSAAGFPLGVVAGHFDADTAIDLAWTLVSGDDAQRGKIQFALAPEISGQRLTGVTRGISSTPPLALISLDLDCDGRDDVIAINSSAAHVLRTGVPISGPAPPSGC